MEEKFVTVDNVQLCTQSFGRRENECVLLIMGATASMLYWDEEFCIKLAQKGFFVIRYDNRDVGRSTSYPPGTTPYDIVDMVDDSIGILKSYDIDKAHFFGMSLGGLIAQIAALKYPERVLSLTLFATGPWGESDPDIPAMDARIVDLHVKASKIDWQDETDVVEYLIEVAQLMSGDNFDLLRAKKLFSNEFKRANSYRSMFNHATLGGGEEFYGKLEALDTKCLIIHGDKDIIWNYRHAIFLKRTLKNSSLVILEGTGHELNPKDWDIIITAFYDSNGSKNQPLH